MKHLSKQNIFSLFSLFYYLLFIFIFAFLPESYEISCVCFFGIAFTFVVRSNQFDSIEDIRDSDTSSILQQNCFVVQIVGQICCYTIFPLSFSILGSLVTNPKWDNNPFYSILKTIEMLNVLWREQIYSVIVSSVLVSRRYYIEKNNVILYLYYTVIETD